jgi:hypothetical protein
MAQKYYIVQDKLVLDEADTWELALQVCRFHSRLSKKECHVLPQYRAERMMSQAVEDFEARAEAERKAAQAQSDALKCDGA